MQCAASEEDLELILDLPEFENLMDSSGSRRIPSVCFFCCFLIVTLHSMSAFFFCLQFENKDALAQDFIMHDALLSMADVSLIQMFTCGV